MDNRIFNVNGQSAGMLRDTLRLVFAQVDSTCCGWMRTRKHGLILSWGVDAKPGMNMFPAELSADECVPFVLAWLGTKEAGETEVAGWDADADHDGHNEIGWRVYVTDWGNVGDVCSTAICAIKPVYLWYGK